MVDKIDFLRFYIRISRTFLRDAFRYQFKFYENFMRHDHAFTKKMPYWILLKSLLVMPIPYHNRMWHTVCRILYRNSKKKQKNTKKKQKKLKSCTHPVNKRSWKRNIWNLKSIQSVHSCLVHIFHGIISSWAAW